MDINDEITLGRCMTPTDLVATVKNGEFIEFSWTKSKGATEFLLELYSDEAMNEKIVDKIILADELPYLWDLDADMVYYARVKAIDGEGKIKDSNWAVYDRKLETYAIKSSLNPELVDRTLNSITIKWTADPEVDHIRITPALDAKDEYTRLDVDADAVSAGQVEVTGLNPSVKYTLAVHFKSADRGTVISWTKPDTDGMLTVTSAEQFAAALADGQTQFVFAYNDGVRYELGELSLNHSLELYGESAPDGSFPSVLVSIKFKNGGTTDAKFRFEQLHLDGSAGSVYGERSNIIDISEAVTSNIIESFTIVNCKVTDYTKNVYYDNKGVALGSLVLRESIFENIGSASQDFASFRAAGTSCQSILIENNTIINNQRDILRIDNCAVPSIIFKNNTVVSNGKLADGGLFIVQKDVTVFEMSSNIFIATYEGEKSFILDSKCKAPTLVANNFFYEAESVLGTSKDLLIANGGAVLTESPCVDYIGGVCNVIEENILKAKAGDPRWLVPYVEVEEDLTQAVTPVNTIWDLSDSKIFRGVADKDMVRGDIRFYVKNTPLNLGGGKIEFTGKSEVDEAGVPTDAGMGVKVNAPGSIVISAVASELSSEHAHLEVSLDGKISASVPVGAEYQKITFPNISTESNIYITACGPISVTFLQWTSDVQVLDKVLATPVVKINKTTVNERAEDNITLTWDAIDYAGSYNVTVDGKVKNVTETTYTFGTADFSVEEAGGDFAIQVTAVPASTDYTRVESAAAELSFHVNDVPVVETGGIPSDPTAIETEYKVVFADDATNFGNLVINEPTTINKLTIISRNDSKTKFDGGVLKFGGASKVGDGNIPTDRYLSFKVTSPGTIYHMSAASGDSGERHLVISLQKAGEATAKVLYDGIKTVAGDADFLESVITEEDLSGSTAAATVYVYCTGNAVNIKGIGFKPTPVGPAPVDKVWDFSSSAWLAVMDPTSKNVDKTDWNIEVDGLKMISGGGGIKWNTMTLNGSELYYWQIGGAGSETKRYFEFTADLAGVVSVYASGTNDTTEPSSRKVVVKSENSEPLSLGAAYKKVEGPVKLDFDVTPGVVKVYTDAGLIFYKIEFHSK